jgi:hypothetical protein
MTARLDLRLALLAMSSALVCACADGAGIARDRAQLGSLRFDVPAAWQRTDQTRSGVATAMWQPANNERKESITVIRTEMSPAVAKAGSVAIEPYLAHAQRSLPQVRASAVTQVKTARGLVGARVDLDFVPPGQQSRYRRVHVVLVDGSALVHVLYTAKHADVEGDAIGVVLDNLQHEGA